MSYEGTNCGVSIHPMYRKLKYKISSGRWMRSVKKNQAPPPQLGINESVQTKLTDAEATVMHTADTIEKCRLKPYTRRPKMPLLQKFSRIRSDRGSWIHSNNHKRSDLKKQGSPKLSPVKQAKTTCLSSWTADNGYGNVVYFYSRGSPRLQALKKDPQGKQLCNTGRTNCGLPTLLPHDFSRSDRGKKDTRNNEWHKNNSLTNAKLSENTIEQFHSYHTKKNFQNEGTRKESLGYSVWRAFEDEPISLMEKMEYDFYAAPETEKPGVTHEKEAALATWSREGLSATTYSNKKTSLLNEKPSTTKADEEGKHIKFVNGYKSSEAMEPVKYSIPSKLRSEFCNTQKFYPKRRKPVFLVLSAMLMCVCVLPNIPWRYLTPWSKETWDPSSKGIRKLNNNNTSSKETSGTLCPFHRKGGIVPVGSATSGNQLIDEWNETSMTAQEKVDKIWTAILNEPIPAEWPSLTESLVRLFLFQTDDISRIDKQQTFRPWESGRLIHTQSAYAQFIWKPIPFGDPSSPQYPYTGIFAEPTRGIITISRSPNAALTATSNSFGLGFKFYRDYALPSGFVAMFPAPVLKGLTPLSTQWNLMSSGVACNHVSIPAGFVLGVGNRKRPKNSLLPEMVRKFPNAIGTSNMAKTTPHGVQVTSPKFPFALCLIADSGVADMIGYASPWHHPAEQLEKIPVYSKIFDVVAIHQPADLLYLHRIDEVATKIATVEIQTTFVRSGWGDRWLHTEHQRFEDDIALQPDWHPQLGAMIFDGYPYISLQKGVPSTLQQVIETYSRFVVEFLTVVSDKKLLTDYWLNEVGLDISGLQKAIAGGAAQSENPGQFLGTSRHSNDGATIAVSQKPAYPGSSWVDFWTYLLARDLQLPATGVARENFILNNSRPLLDEVSELTEGYLEIKAPSAMVDGRDDSALSPENLALRALEESILAHYPSKVISAGPLMFSAIEQFLDDLSDQFKQLNAPN